MRDTLVRADILDEAKKTVAQDRNNQYGEPEDNFNQIAKYWGTYLGVDISSADVAAMMILMKTARLKNDPSKRDTWVDIAGYAGCGGEAATKKAGDENFRKSWEKGTSSLSKPYKAVLYTWKGDTFISSATIKQFDRVGDAFDYIKYDGDSRKKAFMNAGVEIVKASYAPGGKHILIFIVEGAVYRQELRLEYNRSEEKASEEAKPDSGRYPWGDRRLFVPGSRAKFAVHVSLISDTDKDVLYDTDIFSTYDIEEAKQVFNAFHDKKRKNLKRHEQLVINDCSFNDYFRMIYKSKDGKLTFKCIASIEPA